MEHHREYRPPFYLEDFIKKASSAYRLWIAEDLMVFGLIFMNLFGRKVEIYFLRSDIENAYQYWGKILIISAFLIWQLWGVFRSLRIWKCAGKLMRESVILDAWRQVRKMRKFLILTTLLTLFNISLTITINFVPGNSRNETLIVYWFFSYLASMLIRFIYLLLLNKCNKTINYRGNWCIRYESKL